MKVVTGKEMSLIDKYSIEQIGIPGIVLMENAALKILKHIEKFFVEKPSVCKKVVIVAGKGNNAGDAFALARHLYVIGIHIELYCIFDKELLKGNAKENFDILIKLGIKIKQIKTNHDIELLRDDILSSGIVIDGIFGTGFRGEVSGVTANIIDLINQFASYILAIDIPSGIDSATGRVSTSCIRANKTITFELIKIGQIVFPGAEYTGQLIVEGIGMPQVAIELANTNICLSTIDYIKKIIPQRHTAVNKGNCGKLVILSGSKGMAGAGCLTAKGALKSGSGLVYLAVPEDLMCIYQISVPEAVAILLETENGVITASNADSIVKNFNRCDVAAIGPGLSNSPLIIELLGHIAEKVKVPVVLDADALNAISKDMSILARFNTEVVITPHPGEMSRLTGLDTNYIQNNRIEVAKKYAHEWGVIVLLKGARTVIANKNGQVYINPTGNAGMATAGSGDTLTGIIASLIGQRMNSFDAAVAGAYIHGLAGDIMARELGQHGITALDITNGIPFALKNILE